ncbi:MAG: hypothetical protein QOJ62_1687 [Actinomycetota bacterium]|nr:hypothetical protein [Actinomycetota bacterium]
MHEHTGGATDLGIERVLDHDLADQWHRVVSAAADTDYVGLPADPVQELYQSLAGIDKDRRMEYWLGSVAGEPVVAGEVTVPLLDNVKSASLDVEVHPAFRRRGYGSAMFSRLTERALAAGRTRLFAAACEPIDIAARPSAPGSVFGRKVGARAVTAEIRRMLTVAELDRPRLAALTADAESRSSGYSLVQWTDRAPSELLDDLAVLMGLMSTDAPIEDMEWEPEAWTAQRYHDQQEAVAARGRRRIVTVARHDASQRVVAYTDVTIPATQPHIADQWSTIVHGEHRGHRLGMLIKLANLELLLATEPKVRFINTWNAGVNEHMVSINEAMGFRQMERWREWQLDLSTDRVVASR